ncbi:hypothetical protein M9Y10_004653 [Tritrichomonas musculus]|uniref:HNH nuclease domain-containing protein n=1 Tax=Tritrichomonas musculus TaxID=1915356 RepID=A0ABR2JJK6_9EUKA
MACNSKTQTQFVNQGVDYEKLLRDAIQEIKKLRDENEKLKEEIKQLNESLYENDDWNAGIISNLKNEMKELKQRVENLENTVDYDDGIVYPEAQTEGEAEWFDVKDDDDYEIKNIYPYDIRRKSNRKAATESVNKHDGYAHVTLNSHPYRKHIIIAKHFIPNPDHLPIVDHKNHIKTDYHVSNLRWVSTRDNNRNKSSNKGIVYEYVDTIPDDAMKVDTYGKHTFENYFFHDNIFYFYTGINYRKLNINENKWGNKWVSLISDNGKNVSVYYSKFKKEHDIPIE